MSCVDRCYSKKENKSKVFCTVGLSGASLTALAGLALGAAASCSSRGRGGGGGHGVRLLPLLRATLGGLDAFDSAGMAVAFVVSFCLALERERRQQHVNAVLQVPTGV